MVRGVIVEKNRQGTFVYIQNGTVHQIEPSAHVIRVAEWIDVSPKENSEAKRVKYIRTIKSSEFENLKIPLTLLVSGASQIISSFIVISKDTEIVQLSILNLGIGKAKLTSFPSIKINDTIKLGIFKFNRDPGRSEKLEDDKWELVEILKTEVTMKEKKKMAEVASLQLPEKSRIPEPTKKPRPFRFGRQIVEPELKTSTIEIPIIADSSNTPTINDFQKSKDSEMSSKPIVKKRRVFGVQNTKFQVSAISKELQTAPINAPLDIEPTSQNEQIEKKEISSQENYSPRQRYQNVRPKLDEPRGTGKITTDDLFYNRKENERKSRSSNPFPRPQLAQKSKDPEKQRVTTTSSDVKKRGAFGIQIPEFQASKISKEQPSQNPPLKTESKERNFGRNTYSSVHAVKPVLPEYVESPLLDLLAAPSKRTDLGRGRNFGAQNPGCQVSKVSKGQPSQKPSLRIEPKETPIRFDNFSNFENFRSKNYSFAETSRRDNKIDFRSMRKPVLDHNTLEIEPKDNSSKPPEQSANLEYYDQKNYPPYCADQKESQKVAPIESTMTPEARDYDAEDSNEDSLLHDDTSSSAHESITPSPRESSEPSRFGFATQRALPPPSIVIPPPPPPSIESSAPYTPPPTPVTPLNTTHIGVRVRNVHAPTEILPTVPKRHTSRRRISSKARKIRFT